MDVIVLAQYRIFYSLKWDIHSLVTIISKTLYFRFIQLMMHMIFIIDHIYHLMNESKMQSFAYNSDQRIYIFGIRKFKRVRF